ncbi:MAG TPA: P1 family peptidase [Rhizomicrobium sp.]|nr:P1 family peptidase [Rhizomicrobium sp.]
MVKPGKRNLITDVAGLKIGNAEDERVRTGVTVLMGDAPFAAVADIRGGAPGTRDVEALKPVSLVEAIDAITLSGGSAFGLDAPGGVQSVLRAKGRGFQIAPGAPLVPVVSGAILFDLANGGDKEWGDMPPYRALAVTATQNAREDFALGNVGAGLGAMAGMYKGGLGSASAVTDDGFTIGAIAAVNSVGSPLIPGSDVFWAFPFEMNGEFGARRLPSDFVQTEFDLPSDMKIARPRANTTIAIVATDAKLSRVELERVAIMGADGVARALRPVHAPSDGDIVFAVSTARRQIAEPRHRDVMRIGMIAGDCLARSIARGVYEAQSLGPMKSYRDSFARGRHG